MLLPSPRSFVRWCLERKASSALHSHIQFNVSDLGKSWAWDREQLTGKAGERERERERGDAQTHSLVVWNNSSSRRRRQRKKCSHTWGRYIMWSGLRASSPHPSRLTWTARCPPLNGRSARCRTVCPARSSAAVDVVSFVVCKATEAWRELSTWDAASNTHYLSFYEKRELNAFYVQSFWRFISLDVRNKMRLYFVTYQVTELRW